MFDFLFGFLLGSLWKKSPVSQVSFSTSGTVKSSTKEAPKDLKFVESSLVAVLEKAALEYAQMSRSEFKNNKLHIGSTQLRQIGLISTEVWAKIPAHHQTLVSRHPDGTMTAKVLLG